MRLQKMIHKENGKEIIYTHAVNKVLGCRDYTICGLDITESVLNYNEFASYGEEYEGKLKEVNCHSCMSFIEYCKNLK